MPDIRSLTADAIAPLIPALADILIDCVAAGASVSFQQPLARAKAEAYWRGVATAVESGRTLLLVAEDAGLAIGTVQVQFPDSENQPHRGDIAKMLVHSTARRRGIGAALMRAAEDAARAAGRTLLTLDTQSGSGAEALYSGLGWTRVGEIPRFALTPYDGLCATTLFYKEL
jgi:ribosomal protein S18 acetylase RimI-like enzyme